MQSMKTIGLIGGMSWESSIEYYRIINEVVRRRLGGLHSAKCLMYSFDFEEIAALQRHDAWDQAASRMIDAGTTLAGAGAEFIVICTNTMHKMAPDLQAAVALPLLHIVDPTAERVKARGLTCVGLLATRSRWKRISTWDGSRPDSDWMSWCRMTRTATPFTISFSTNCAAVWPRTNPAGACR